jgi:hypothetical protein
MHINTGAVVARLQSACCIGLVHLKRAGLPEIVQ